MKKNLLYIYGIAGLLGLILILNTLFVVDETSQCIITQFGDPVGKPIVTAGLHIKAPFIHKVTYFEKRIMEWDGDSNQIPTKDKKYLLVDTFARWRIVDPLKFYQSVNNERNALGRLDDIIDGITRDYISENELIEIVRNSNRTMAISTEASEDALFEADSLKIEKGRMEITKAILKKVQEIVPQYGIAVDDIRIKQVNYIEEVRTKVFDRMISERKRIAQLYRSEGQGTKSEIEGQMQKELQRVNSEAYRQAQMIKGKADAEAADIYAKAFNNDPEFYSFLETLNTYRTSIDKQTTIILSTDNDYLRYLKVTK